MKISPLLSLIAVLVVPAGAADDRATYDFDAVASANKKKNNLRRAAADKSVYIVSFNAKTTGPAARCNSLANAHAGSTVFTYANVLNGGCALELTEGAANALKQRGDVASVEEDGEVTAFAQVPAPSGAWGLDRVDQCHVATRDELDNFMTKQEAAGTRVFILDTGIRSTHTDFTAGTTTIGTCNLDATGEGGELNDGNGHGTHVASTACGNTYGVAQNCELCSVKVLKNSGSGSYSGVIQGISHAAENCPSYSASQKPCVANMSLGGGFSSALNDAVNDAVAAGVIMVVAAGNDNGDACTKSPASATDAITVGSTGQTINNVFYPDTRSSFSNYGTCLDIFAPGRSITAAWKDGDNNVNTISGTSMASPHVAGLAAGIVGGGASSPAEVRNKLLEIGEKNAVTNPGSGSPNEFASTCNSSTTGTPTEAPTTPPPVPPTPSPTTPPPTPAPVAPPCSLYTFQSCPTPRCNKINNRGDKCCRDSVNSC